MYPGGGGVASNVVDLTVCSQPREPDRTASRTARNPGVEAPLEPDLHPGRAASGGLDHVQRAVDVGGDGLLAEDGQPGLDAALDELGMGPGRGGDDQAVEARAEQFGHRAGHLGAEPPSDLPGQARVRVRDDQRVNTRKSAQRAGVERADPAHPDESYAHQLPCDPPRFLSTT